MAEDGEAKEKCATVPASPVTGLVLVDDTTTDVVSVEHALLVPLSSVTEYGGVPPTIVTVPTTVAVCPESI